MTESVRQTSTADQAWVDLSAQLTPAASLARIDAVTARAVTTVTVIGLLLTGLGALGAGQFARHGAARGLAVAAVVTATLAVASALAAQVLTITRGLNTDDLLQVKAWYRRQFNIRARTTQAATILLILAAILAGATSIATLLTTPHAAKTTSQAHAGVPGLGRPPSAARKLRSLGEAEFNQALRAFLLNNAPGRVTQPVEVS
jgi:hypothetical protein